MSPIRAVIFDLDQTLLDREASLSNFLDWQITEQLCEDLDNPNAFKTRFIELDANGMIWKDRVYAALIEEFKLHKWTVEKLLSTYLDHFCKHCIEKEGATETVKELSKNSRLGLISNGKSPFQENNFKALGFSSHFHSILVSEAIGLRKPDAKIFKLSCSELGVTPEQSVYVGDNPISDIEGAKNAGLRTVFIPSEHYPKCAMANATCHNLELLPQIIYQLY